MACRHIFGDRPCILFLVIADDRGESQGGQSAQRMAFSYRQKVLCVLSSP